MSDQTQPQTAPKQGRPRRHATTPVSYRRPGLDPEAETFMFPAAGRRAPDRDVVSQRDGVAALVAMSQRDAESRNAVPGGEYRPSGRRIWISRGVLFAILCMQAILSLRMANGAFEDEALYLYAGHMELAHLLHGAPLPQSYGSYFSGSPVLYPVLGAAADTVGGLAAARLVSLAAMLTTTALLYSLTRHLFNERVSLCAAVVFSVTEPTIFLGNFATYDAPALCLLALASWIVVRTVAFRWPVYLLAAPVATLAIATKYASLLLVPTIVVLAALAAWPHRGRKALIYPLPLALLIAGLLAGGIHWGGPAYLHAIETTTTARAPGRTPTVSLLRDVVLWEGLPFALALIGTFAYARRSVTEAGEHIAPAGGRVRRLAVGIVLTGTAVLPAAEQFHLHTDVSLHKHVGFGLFFAAPMAGLGLARVIGDHFRRPQFGVALWGMCLILGMTQASELYAEWPNPGPLVQELTRYLEPGAHYLVEAAEVPTYYFMRDPDVRPGQFLPTYYLSYTSKQGRTLTGTAAFEAAINEGYFRIVAYDYTATPGLDKVLSSVLEADPDYRLAAAIPGANSSGTYYIWVRRDSPGRTTGPHPSRVPPGFSPRSGQITTSGIPHDPGIIAYPAR